MKYSINNSQIQIIVDTLGAELVSLSKEGYEYMWSADARFWGRTSPVLFPIVGALKDNSYSYGGQRYQLPQHGFARDREFKLIAQEENRLSFLLCDDAKTRENYPFGFELSISYILDASSVTIEYKVKNSDNKTLYFSLGTHPAFALELNDTIGMQEYSLVFTQKEDAQRLLLDGALIGLQKEPCLQGKELQLYNGIFDKNALVFDSIVSNEVKLQCKKSTKSITVSYPNFPYIAFWSVPNAPYICIEPWEGIADSVNASGQLEEKRGIKTLEVNEEFVREMKIAITM